MVNKIMVRTDMEGVSGVVNYSQVTPGASEYAFGQDMFMNDLLALIDGIQASDVEEVVLFDEHASGRNTRMEELPNFVSSINGKPLYTPDWAGGIDSSFDAMMMLGLHGKTDAIGGTLPHTYGNDILDIRLNGISVGEIGMEAALAGDCGVPTLLIIADSVGATEAETLIPGIHTVITKESLGETAAHCFSPSLVARRIREGAIASIRDIKNIKPYVVKSPVRLEVTLRDNNVRQQLRAIAPDAFITDDVVRIDAETTTIAWGNYLHLDWQARQK